MHPKNKKQFKLDKNGWFDYWHAHDWNYKNDKYRDFDIHVGELMEMYDEIKEFQRQLDRPTQSWVLIDENDPLQDSIYLHSKNPNTPYPHKFNDIEWGVETPLKFKRLMNNKKVGKIIFNGDFLYYVM